jgi:uncharacterized Tic20 family protein
MLLREDRNLLMITHLMQLIDFATVGVGGFIVPLILWQTQKDKVIDMNEHGKAIMNFQLSMIIYALVCVPLVFLGIGILGLIAIGLLEIAFPIINGLKASKGEPIDYPFSLKLIK